MKIQGESFFLSQNFLHVFQLKVSDHTFEYEIRFIFLNANDILRLKTLKKIKVSSLNSKPVLYFEIQSIEINRGIQTAAISQHWPFCKTWRMADSHISTTQLAQKKFLFKEIEEELLVNLQSKDTRHNQKRLRQF